MTLSQSFLAAYPGAYIDSDGFIIVRRTKCSIYHPVQNFLIRGWVGFKSQDDAHEQIIYSIYPCNEHQGRDGDTWISSDRTPTFTTIVSTVAYNAMLKECMQVGYKVLNVDASTCRDLVNDSVVDSSLQHGLDKIALERSLSM